MAERTTRALGAALRSRREERRDRPADQSKAPGAAHTTVIESSLPSTGGELRELWRARETALTFAWRDVKVRYKQSLIGIAWAIVQPLLTMVVFTVIFGKFANFPSQGQHYQIFVYAGLLPWLFFSSALTQISSSVLANRQLVQKVYFPRLILPLSGVLVPTIDFLFSSLVLAGLMVWYGVGVGWHIVLGPLFLFLIVVTAWGVGAAFATVTVRYRDVPYVIPFIVSIWLYLSPVIYPSAALPDKWKWLLSFNPIVAGVTGFRWSVLGTPPPSTLELAAGIPVAVALLIAGFSIYRRWESRFADTI